MKKVTNQSRPGKSRRYGVIERDFRALFGPELVLAAV